MFWDGVSNKRPDWAKRTGESSKWGFFLKKRHGVTLLKKKAPGPKAVSDGLLKLPRIVAGPNDLSLPPTRPSTLVWRAVSKTQNPRPWRREVAISGISHLRRTQSSGTSPPSVREIGEKKKGLVSVERRRTRAASSRIRARVGDLGFD